MKAFVFLLFTIFSTLSAWALDVPILQSPVTDKAGVLSLDDKNKLESQIRNMWEQEKQVQISVLIIPSLEGEVIENYSIKVAEKWQLGTKKDDNGLLILIALQDRKMRIEVGNGIEGIVTDAKSGRMINDMKPFLRNKDYYGAVKNTVDSIHSLMKANTPEAIAQRAADEKIESERRAEQAKINTEQRAATMAQLAQFAVWALVGFLFLVAGYNLYDNYFAIPKELKTLKAEQEQLTNRLAKENTNLSEQSNKLQTMKVDRIKQSYVRNQNVHEDLVGRKSQLISSIKTMKKYLGVK